MAGNSRTQRHMSNLRNLRAEDPNMALTLDTLGQVGTPQTRKRDVYHVKPKNPSVVAGPGKGAGDDKLKDRPKPLIVEEGDSLGISALLSEICRLDIDDLVVSSRCRSGNPVHSTATESELARRIKETPLVKNIFGSKECIRVRNTPHARVAADEQVKCELVVPGSRPKELRVLKVGDPVYYVDPDTIISAKGCGIE